MYENIRAIFIRILDTAGRYEIIDNTTITLNSAY